jgi:hypothetical protein
MVLAGGLLLPLALVAPAARAQRDRSERSDKQPPPAGMRARVFQVKHQDVESLVDALKPLASGTPGAMLRSNEDLQTVTVRDFPENVAAVEQAIKRLDVPGVRRPDVELRIYVLIGSPSAPSGPTQYPSELEPVVRQLAATLSYRSYFQVAALTQRIRPDGGANGKGELMIAPPASDQAGSAKFHYSCQNVAVSPAATGGGPLQVTLRRFHFELEGNDALGEAEVSTGLTLRDGEKVVVGTGSLKNRAMIIVLAARLLR